MVVRKSHLMILVVVAVAVLAYLAQRYESNKALNAQKSTTITLCESSVERASYVANGFRILSNRVAARNHPGDATSAKNYEAVADSIVSTFPGVARQDSRVDRIETFDGKIVYRIPDEARILEIKGCEEAFAHKLPAR